MIFYILGILANIFVALRAFPQIIKILYYKSATDVSYLTNIFIIFYASFWLGYSLIKHEIILLEMVLILIISSLIIIGLKIYFDQKNDQKLQKITEYLDLSFKK